MDALRSWIVTLVSVAILCTLIEKFAPQGNLSRHVKLVCGLAVTVVIAMPVINLLKGDFKLENVAWNEYARLSEGELKNRIDRIQDEDSRDMLMIYRESLISDIKVRFQGEGEFIITDVDVVLHENQNDSNFGMIRALYLTLEPGSENPERVLTGQTENYIRNELTHAFAVDKGNIIIDQSHFVGGG